MNFTKQTLVTVSLAIFALGGCAINVGVEGAHAQQDGYNSASAAQTPNPSEKFDITTLSCWDISTLSEADVAYASVLLYGYTAGQSGTHEHSGNSIESAITQAGETCAANPDMMAIQAFK